VIREAATDTARLQLKEKLVVANSAFFFLFFSASRSLVLLCFFLSHDIRAAAIPKKFKDMLVPGKISQTLCTGNLCTREVLDWLRTVTSDIHVVAGDLDEASSEFPQTKTVTIGAFKIGLAHGHAVVPWGDKESLAILQRKLDCDVLITGHTHKFEAYAYQVSAS
jgi:putative phosphoesterase